MGTDIYWWVWVGFRAMRIYRAYDRLRLCEHGNIYAFSECLNNWNLPVRSCWCYWMTSPDHRWPTSPTLIFSTLQWRWLNWWMNVFLCIFNNIMKSYSELEVILRIKWWYFMCTIVLLIDKKGLCICDSTTVSYKTWRIRCIQCQ